MTPKLQRLNDRLLDVLGERVAALTERLGELTLEVRAADYLSTAQMLRDHPALRFAQLIDLCGIDYSTYGDRPWPRERYAVALQLLSLEEAASASKFRISRPSLDPKYSRYHSLAIIMDMISLEPVQMDARRRSRSMRSMGKMLVYPIPPITCMAIRPTFWQDSVTNFFVSETMRRTRPGSTPESTALAVV